MPQQRNNLVEFARFLFSLLVVGYHVQMTWAGNKLSVFEGGALAVEFFFLISGYFLARSIEKISAKEEINIFKETLMFMWGKIKAILPVHVVAIIGMVIVILSTKINEAGKIILNGLPSVFLVHMIVVWNDSFNLALIVPEWYISSMLICMLFMFPIGVLLHKKINGALVTLCLLGILVIALLIYGFSAKWKLSQNFVYDLRAWGEMYVGMFAYFFSPILAKKVANGSKLFPILEVIFYILCKSQSFLVLFHFQQIILM